MLHPPIESVTQSSHSQVFGSEAKSTLTHGCYQYYRVTLPELKHKVAELNCVATILVHGGNRLLKVLRTTPIIILSLCLNACAMSAAQYMVSSATSESSGTTVTQGGKLRLQGLVIVVKPANSLIVAGGSHFIFDFLEDLEPQDYRYTSIYYDNPLANTKDSFILEILVSTNDHEMSITPMKMGLDIAGKKIYPVSYYVLEPRYTGTGFLRVIDLCKRPGAESWNADNALKSAKENSITEPILLTKQNRYCFAVKYGMPPIDPRSIFSVEIEGLSIDGKAVAPPVIRYAPDTYRSRSA